LAFILVLSLQVTKKIFKQIFVIGCQALIILRLGFFLKINLIFLKIKENSRKWELLTENLLVYNFTHKMDILKILKHMSLSEKVVFKDTCRWL